MGGSARSPLPPLRSGRVNTRILYMMLILYRFCLQIVCLNFYIDLTYHVIILFYHPQFGSHAPFYTVEKHNGIDLPLRTIYFFIFDAWFKDCINVSFEKTSFLFYPILKQKSIFVSYGFKENHTSCYDVNPKAYNHGLLVIRSVDSASEFETSCMCCSSGHMQ